MVSPCSDRISRVPPYSRTISHLTLTGLSPITARLSNLFSFIPHCHWPGPRSLATTCGVSVDVLSCRYLDVSVPCVRFLHPMYSGADTLLTIPRNHSGRPCRTTSRFQLSSRCRRLCLLRSRRGGKRLPTRYRAVWLPYSNVEHATSTGR